MPTPQFPSPPRAPRFPSLRPIVARSFATGSLLTALLSPLTVLAQSGVNPSAPAPQAASVRNQTASITVAPLPQGDQRPVAFAYKAPDSYCPACNELVAASDQLPVRIEWKAAPAWVTAYPTVHWKTAGDRWVHTTGWPGVEKFKADYARWNRHTVRHRGSPPRALSPFYYYTWTYGGRIWSYPGDIKDHLKNDLSNHGFSDVELRGLSPLQMQRLHSAHHEGLVSPGKEPPGGPESSIDIHDEAMAYRSHGSAYFREGNLAEALADYHEAIELEPKNSDVNSSLAWFWATSRDPNFRDGKKAVKYALQACELSGYAVWNQIGTLAAAYAEAGQKDLAVHWAKASYDMAPEDEKPGCEERLKLYQAGKSFRRR